MKDPSLLPSASRLLFFVGALSGIEDLKGGRSERPDVVTGRRQRMRDVHVS